MNLAQNLKESVTAIRANLMRSVLTMLVISVGIMALIGVLTAIEGMKYWFSHQFVSIGANSFRVDNYETNLKERMGNRKGSAHAPITWQQAREFKRSFNGDCVVGITEMANVAATATWGSRTTQNNLQLIGADENYAQISNYELAQGRNLNPADVSLARNVILLGSEPARLLFENADPLGKMVQMDGNTYEVAGVFAEKGASSATGGDRICIIPVTRAARDYPEQNKSYSLNVQVRAVEAIDDRMEEARGLLRRIRSLRPRDADDFGMVKSEAIVDNLMENLRFLTWSATAIALITLLSASIGLMNIMLVSVTERTREIGVRKAMGATRRNILLQFLTEAILICQLGGLGGILAGILIGNILSLVLNTAFIVPWLWVGIGIGLCTLVGLVSGLYPANKAASVDPIESLRYE